jgi:hypothetical protein
MKLKLDAITLGMPMAAWHLPLGAAREVAA